MTVLINLQNGNYCFYYRNLKGLKLTFTNLKTNPRTSLEVQRLRLRASAVGGMGSIPGWGTKIPRAA